MSVIRISKALIQYIFHTPPTSPEIGKWTKIGPTLDRVSIGMGTHGIYAAVFEAAFASRKGFSCQVWIHGFDPRAVAGYCGAESRP